MDLASGSVRTVVPRELLGEGWTRNAALAPGDEPPAILHYAGRHAYGIAGRGMEARKTILHRIDLLTGESTATRPIDAEGFSLVLGMRSTIFLGSRKGNTLLSLDPETLDTLETIAVPADASSPFFVGGGIVVFVDHDKCLERAETPVSVLERGSGRLIERLTVQLENEKIIAVGGDRSAVYVVIGGGDLEQYRGGGRGTWFRVESFPLGEDGARWTYDQEGLAGGNPVIEGDAVVFPAYEGKFPAPDAARSGGDQGVWGKVEARIPLKRISLDRRTGARLGEAPLAPEAGFGASKFRVDATQHLCDPFGSYSLGEIFSPPAPRRIFPGKATSVRLNNYFHEEYWLPSDRDPPVKILPAAEEGSDLRIIPFEANLPLMLSWNDTVLESIGGGVILVKDLAGGQGLKRLSPERLDRGQW